MRPIVALLLALAAPAGAAEPIVRQEPQLDPPQRLLGGAEPSIRQEPRLDPPQQRLYVPQYRHELTEQLRDFERDSALGRLDPFERREMLETRQKLDRLDRSLDRD